MGKQRPAQAKARRRAAYERKPPLPGKDFLFLLVAFSGPGVVYLVGCGPTGGQEHRAPAGAARKARRGSSACSKGEGMKRKRQLTQLPFIWHDESALLARISEQQSRLVTDMLAKAEKTEHYAQENAQLTLDLSGTRAALQGSVDRLQEVHHRVRNHLQTLTGLLSAQELTEPSPSARRTLQKSIARITSVAAIHDLLARDPRSGKLQLPDLVNRLVGHLLSSAGAERRVRARLDVAPIDLPQRESTAFVLILAELVCNAVEHGFADDASGQISVRIAAEDSQAVLEVADDGAGLRPDFDWESADSLGLGLVLRLAERDLNGSATAWNDAGAHFRVRFPIPRAERSDR